MDAGWLRRLRWRRRGAWLWPAFPLAMVADTAIGVRLPAAGESQSLLAAAVAALVLNALGVVALSRALGWLVRRSRPDLPAVVARDYAGTTILVAIAAALLFAGLNHRQTILGHRRAQATAVRRAQAYISARAPREFRRGAEWVNTFAIEAGRIYRACVQGVQDGRFYCVIVDLEGGVRFSGYEPNSVFSEGVN
jgi:hypothetical protein